MKTILIFDAENIFCSGYVKNPSLNSQGVPVGGIATILNNIKYSALKYNPVEVIVVWGGENGVKNKRKYLPEYKISTAPPKEKRLNRQEYVATLDNKKIQFDLLKRIIDCLPVRQICIDDLEGDNTLYLTYLYYKDKADKHIVLSGDKDFYQMLSKDTIIYKPQKRKEYTIEDFRAEYEIRNPKNFVLYKTLVGDASDKIKGLHGFGPKSFSKHFEEICLSVGEYTWDMFLSHVQGIEPDDKSLIATQKNILQQQDKLKLFYRAIKFWNNGYMSEIKKQLDKPLSFRYNNLLLECSKNGIDNYMIEPLFQVFGTYRRTK